MEGWGGDKFGVFSTQDYAALVPCAMGSPTHPPAPFMVKASRLGQAVKALDKNGCNIYPQSMTAALPPALTQLVERLLHTGRYADEGEGVREGPSACWSIRSSHQAAVGKLEGA